MRVEGFFENVGEALGTLLRWIIDALYGLFAAIAEAGRGFLNGLAGALGMDASLIRLAALGVGLLIPGCAARALRRRALLSGVLLLLSGLWLMCPCIHITLLGASSL